MLEIARQARTELYDLNMDRAPALAPWELRPSSGMGMALLSMMGMGLAFLLAAVIQADDHRCVGNN